MVLFLPAPIDVGYEFTIYSTSETEGEVQLCAQIYNPNMGGALRPFVISSTTRDGSASKSSVCFEWSIFDDDMFNSPVAGVDYEQQSVNLEFAHGTVAECHNVTILKDDDCELPMEKFFADLSYVSGIQTINIIFPTTEVNIHESNEPECGKFHFYFYSSFYSDCFLQNQL